jgi:MSHA pilin protein MshD
MCTNRHTARGFTLIELIAFIAMMAVGVAGVLLGFRQATIDSADPLLRKQALAIAESMLQEVQQMPFTYCDPDDPAVSTATSSAGCSTAEALGPESGETRYSTTTPFDNVNDYNGYSTASEGTTGIKDMTGASIPNLTNFDVAVSVAATALNGIGASDSLLITVTVTGPRNTTVMLQSFRTRYAPNL